MQKLPEAVISKVNELIAALHYAADDLKIIGQEAMLSGDFAQVTESMDACKKLQMLEDEIGTAVNNFYAKKKSPTSEKINYHKPNKRRTRTHGGHLRVNIAGTSIENDTIAETFLETLKVLGLERVAKLNKTITSIPLVSKNPNQWLSSATSMQWLVCHYPC
ncbi:hypothetical protein [Methylocucumis oryzae]|uniref:hypothetical protein n=1 Tax=Methylocucumis oryzae TaxID=1632867 RepID=UPI000696B46D|nr:hypothetical protein [Methylocucumis oryzae]